MFSFVYTVFLRAPTSVSTLVYESLRVTALLSVLGLVWCREGKGTGAWHSRNVLALERLRGSENVTKLGKLQRMGGSTKCFSIENEGFRFPREGRDGWAGSRSELMEVGKTWASSSIPWKLLGMAGGRNKSVLVP